MNRRALLAAALALVAAPALAEGPQPSQKTVEAGKLFPYLAHYLKLPPADRDRWTLVYEFSFDGKPASGVQGWIDDGGRRVPITFGPGGRALTLPTLAQLNAKRQMGLDVPSGTKLNVSLRPEPTLKPAPELAAAELIAALQQAGRGARKAAPMMLRAVIPKFDTVYLPGAQGAEVVAADGRATPLPVEKGTPVFRPSQHPTAAKLRFATPPRRMALG
jgi:hypothetical protein